MIDGIILAAGRSERAKTFKPAMLLEGKPLIKHCIDSMRPVCDRILVVGGYAFETLRDLCINEKNVLLVYNEHADMGMFSSVKCGLQVVKGEHFFLIPGDQPVVKTETYRYMLQSEGDIIIPQYQGKKGHPVLFSSVHISRLLALPDEAILRDYLHHQPVTILDVDDPGIVMDVDNPEDFEKMQAYIHKNSP
ncbi:MAG: nucleotidyltransferase family protein [Candidatus Marinimicrobia bacterium]|nr:nucleotidyltransferase family protein [Candidatus Neomarinimicrobiota bacterium]